MSTKKLRLTASIVALFLSIIFNSYSQTERQLVAKYREALGNSVRIDSTRSMELRGEFRSDDITVPVKLWTKFPNYTRTENRYYFQVSNDTIRWEYDPETGESSITSIDPAKDKQEGLRTFDFLSRDLLNYEKLNYRVKLRRKEKMDSLEVYRLELFKNKDTKPSATFFIDTKTSLFYKIEDDLGYRYFADYTRVHGFAFPRFVIDSKENIQGRFTQISIDVEVPDSLFFIPKDILEHRDRKSDDLLKKADDFFLAGQYDSADRYYTRVIKKNDESFDAYNSRGKTHLEKDEYYEAIADFNRAMQLRPAYWVPVNYRGKGKYYLRDFDGAINDFGKSIALDSTTNIPYTNRGIAYLQLMKYELAEKDFTKALKLDDKDSEAQFHLSYVFLQTERYQEALQSYQRTIRLNYSSRDVYNGKGFAEYYLQLYDSALVSFHKALLQDPENGTSLTGYGTTLYVLNKYHEAIEVFERCLKKDPSNATAYNFIGLCKENDEDYEGAIKDFSKAIELDEKSATYYNNRAEAKEQIEDYDGAIADYSMSIQIYPNDASVFYERGLMKIYTSKKIEGCLDLATANEMKYEPAKEAIIENCN